MIRKKVPFQLIVCTVNYIQMTISSTSFSRLSAEARVFYHSGVVVSVGSFVVLIIEKC